MNIKWDVPAGCERTLRPEQTHGVTVRGTYRGVELFARMSRTNGQRMEFLGQDLCTASGRCSVGRAREGLAGLLRMAKDRIDAMLEWAGVTPGVSVVVRVDPF